MKQGIKSCLLHHHHRQKSEELSQNLPAEEIFLHYYSCGVSFPAFCRKIFYTYSQQNLEVGWLYYLPHCGFNYHPHRHLDCEPNFASLYRLASYPGCSYERPGYEAMYRWVCVLVLRYTNINEQRTSGMRHVYV